MLTGVLLVSLLLSCTNDGLENKPFLPDKVEVLNYPWETPDVWKSNGAHKETLFHFSSSIFISEKKTGLYTRWDVLPEDSSQTNFIRSLFNTGHLKKTVWVVPFRNFYKQPHRFLRSRGLEPSDYRITGVKKGILKCSIKKIPVKIVALKNLPSPENPVCLNLDPSYFNYLYLTMQRNQSVTREINSPADILKKLKEKNISIKFTTLLSYKHFRGHLMKLRGEFTIPWTENLLRGGKIPDYSRRLKSLEYQLRGNYSRASSLLKNIEDGEDLLIQKLILGLESAEVSSVAGHYRKLVEKDSSYETLRGKIGEFIFNRFSQENASNFYKMTERETIEENGSTQTEIADSNKNILLITADTLRGDAAGCYGNKIIKTPAIDSLASRGIVFDSAYSPIPQTSPSHASLLTGRYPTTLGTLDNGMVLGEKWTTLAEFLKKRGYRTGAIVSGYPLESNISGLDQGFDIYDDEFTREVNGEYTEKPAKEVTTRALDFLKNKKTDSRPYFLWVHYYDPHGPYKPPPSFQSPYEGKTNLFDAGETSGEVSIPEYQKFNNRSEPAAYRSAYAAEITYLDKELGRMLEEVNRKTTAVVFTADHGESMGEHSIYFDHGQNLYQENIHIPLIVDLPGMKSSGRFQRITELTEIAPALARWCGLEGFKVGDGALLTSLKQGNVSGKEYAFATTGNVYLRDPSVNQLISIRSGNYKLVYSLQSDDSFLYDLTDDPGERRNISQKFPVLTGNLKTKLLNWWENTTDLSGSGTKLTKDEKEKLKSLGYISQ